MWIDGPVALDWHAVDMRAVLKFVTRLLGEMPLSRTRSDLIKKPFYLFASTDHHQAPV